MAVQGSGTKPMGATIDPAMKSGVTSGPINPRSGAAKKTQTSFATHPQMVDQQKFAGASPGAAGTGPDASSPDVMDPESHRTLKRQPQILSTPWGGAAPWAKNGDGKGLDPNIGGKVLSNAQLSGSTKLPAATSLKTDSGSAPKPWPAQNSGG